MNRFVESLEVQRHSNGHSEGSICYRYRHRDRAWPSNRRALAPHLPSGWVTCLGLYSTRYRGRYGRKRDEVGYPDHGYRPKAGSAPAQVPFPPNERQLRRCVPDTAQLRHAGACQL
jgi:hypothetical protein